MLTNYNNWKTNILGISLFDLYDESIIYFHISSMEFENDTNH